MIKLLRTIVPAPIKRLIRKTIKFFKYTYRYYHIMGVLKRGENIKIIVGAAETYQNGWCSTNEQWLDITKEEDWKKIFGGRKCVSRILAEHVMEHLTYDQAREALRLFHAHLVDGGKIRIAVPDGFHPDETYIRHIGINGIGDDAADHKQLLDVNSLSALIQNAGFVPEHIEGYEQDKKTLIVKQRDPEDGFVVRSRIHQDNEEGDRWDFPDANTSLIVDGVKAA